MLITARLDFLCSLEFSLPSSTRRDGWTGEQQTGFVRVQENLESPGKGLLVLESSGNLLNSSEKI